MSDKSADLQKLFSLSSAMLVYAQSDQWDEVCALEVIRRELIVAIFLLPVPAELKLKFDDGIRSILDIDQQIMALGLGEKRELEQLLRQIDQGKRAIKAYSS
jgi:hypothetical protein